MSKIKLISKQIKTDSEVGTMNFCTLHDMNFFHFLFLFVYVFKMKKMFAL